MNAEEQVILPRTASSAIWSLVLSIAGFILCCIPLSIPAVICGHLAISRINRSVGMLTGQGLAIAGLVVGYAGIALQILLLPAILLPAIAAVRQAAFRAVCVSDMRQIGVSLTEYAQANGGRFPSDFQSLVPQYTVGFEPKMFIYQGAGKEPGDMTNVDKWTDYVLVPNRTLNDPGDAVLAVTKPDCLRDRGGNVLFVNGSVRSCDQDEYDRLTRQFQRPPPN
jgi:hypothetical protein